MALINTTSTPKMKHNSIVIIVNVLKNDAHTFVNHVQRCSVKKVFLKISQIHRKTTVPDSGKETLAQVFSCEFCKISKNTFFHRTPLVAASECNKISLTLFRMGGAKRPHTSFSPVTFTNV